MKQSQLFFWLEQISAAICGKFWQEKLKNTKDKMQQIEIVSVRLLSFYFGGSKIVTKVHLLLKLKLMKIGSCHRRIASPILSHFEDLP